MTATDQSRQHTHKVLLAGRPSGHSHAAGSVIRPLNIRCIHAENAQAALEAVQSSPRPFSIVICDDHVQGVDGTDLLTRIKNKSPDTFRFLVSENFDLPMAAKAVNQAKVHRCIPAPCPPEALFEIIEQGLAEYEQNLAQRRLFIQARKQNGKLYELNCGLIETSKSYEKDLTGLEQEIENRHTELENKTLKRPLPPGKLAKLIRQYLETGQEDPGTVLAQLYEQVLISLYADCTEVALGNGIESPEPPDLTADISVPEQSPDEVSEQKPETDEAGNGN